MNRWIHSVELAVEMVKDGDNGIPVPDYVDLNVSSKVVKIIQSYSLWIHRMQMMSEKYGEGGLLSDDI